MYDQHDHISLFMYVLIVKDLYIYATCSLCLMVVVVLLIPNNYSNIPLYDMMSGQCIKSPRALVYMDRRQGPIPAASQ